MTSDFVLHVPRSAVEPALPTSRVSPDDPRWAKLREPFPASQVGKLPRVWCKACRDVARQGRTCEQHQKRPCPVCRNNMTTAHLHLDYVGHAAVTNRLLEVDPFWQWEPMVRDENGWPKLDPEGNLWINLTVLGVTRPGYGTEDRTDSDATKILIGDAIRNAAMRFGVALDLWSKEDLAPQAEAAAEQADVVERGLAEGEEKSSGRDWIAEVRELQAATTMNDNDSLVDSAAKLGKLANEANDVGEFKGAAKAAMASLRRTLEAKQKALDKAKAKVEPEPEPSADDS